MKKSNFNLLLYTFIFLFAGVVIFVVCKKSNQSIPAISIQLEFEGEYSQNGGEWQKLSKDTDLSAFEGDLLLRGRFEPDLTNGANIFFYLNHIGMTVSVKGEDEYYMSNEIYQDMCGTNWQEWLMPAISENDVIEIRLHNPHCYGNKEAYNELLDSIYFSGRIQLKQYYDKKEMPYRFSCIFIIVASITLIGTSIACKLLKLPKSTLLLKFGVMSLLMGVYMYFDTKDISLLINKLVFNTYMKHVTMMLATLMFSALMPELLHGKRKKIAQLALYMLMIFDVVFLTSALLGIRRIYDTGILWAFVMAIVSLIMIVFALREVKDNERHNRVMLVSAILLFGILTVELFNARFSWWQSGIVLKSVFSVIFIFLLLWAAKMVAFNYQASIQAQKLEKELKENRISLAMSQIQPHFIYNSLNSIYHLCDKDVEMAQQAISDFSDYLQRSISAVDRTTLISFEEELKHVKIYLKLEQLRFGKDLNVEYNIESEKFMLPALSVQPLVENAVKHGICMKEGGGTVTLTVKECKDYFEIVVSDDGVGFIPEKDYKSDGNHVGIRNVRQRLDIMCRATLEVGSEPGKGTISTIRIPKREDGHEHIGN